MYVVRRLRPDEAIKYTLLIQRISIESDFMLKSLSDPCALAGNATACVEAVAAQLLRLNSTILVVEGEAGMFCGYLSVKGGDYERNRHRAELTMGILRTHRRRGLGRRLMNEVDRWAPSGNVSRLELSVVAHNHAALNLYVERGYRIEGVKLHALKVDGKFRDGLYMAKLLEAGELAQNQSNSAFAR